MSAARWAIARSRASISASLSAGTGPSRLQITLRSASFTQTRSYAKQKGRGEPTDQKQKGSHGMSSTDTLVPGSQRIAAGEEYTKTETKMKTTADWYRKEVAALETRATGRVTPAVLAPVRVQLPGHESADGKGVRLEEIATVGVKEGTMLLVTVFEEHTLKYVEQAIYDAKLPGITPQKQDSRTIKIPIPKPTVETRLALYTNAQRQAEDTRVQIRKHHQAALKKGKYGKHSPQIQEFQTLTDKYLSEVDKILADLKKSTGAK